MDIKQILTADEKEQLFLLGNEATVRGALEAGVGLASTYPGTPSSEIGDVFSKIATDAGLYFEFSTNEKVALEVAAAAAASGVRSFTFMKHVGVNVASDSLMSVAYTSVEGGMVILSADDPSMFSSQNEQDNRHYARLANIPMVEPSNPQEIIDLMNYSYEISEEFKIPVLMRTTTRVSHMRGVVTTGVKKENIKKGFFERDPKRFVPVPSTAMVMHKVLVEKMDKLKDVSNASPLNRFYDRNGKIGVITSGGAFNYVMDTIEENNLDINVLKISFSYPFPDELVLEFIKDLDRVVVVEEVDPIMEKEILSIIGQNGLKIPVHGKLDGTLPMIYEYSPNILLDAMKLLGKDVMMDSTNNNAIPVPVRPPTLCPGCPHRAVYYSVKSAVSALKLENVIFPTDIGCYTLGVTSPYNAADYLLSMGSSIGTSCGFSKATDQSVISFIGDSTFFHAGIPPLINAVHNKNRFVVVILDNRTTAMTGGQSNPGMPVDGMGAEAPEVSIEEIVKATGVKFVRTINPLNIKKSQETFEKAIEFQGVAVVISKYPCMLIKGARKKDETFLEVEQDKCGGCDLCLQELACTAIYTDEEGYVQIDPQLCNKCNICVQICPEKAIRMKKK